MRFDVTLHALRLFKSRSQAAAAIENGGALLNGRLVKSSHVVRPGDWVTIVAPSGGRTVEVLELPNRSLSREQARNLVKAVEPC